MTSHRVNLFLMAILTSSMLPCHGQAMEAPEQPVIKPEVVTPAAEGAEKPAEKAEVQSAAVPVAPLILGWKEWLWIIKPDLILRAKLDTGARTSSIHATNIETLEVDGEKWVKFTVSDPSNEKGVRFRHKAPVVRISKVKNDTGGLDERYVVPLTFQIGGKKMEAEFNLNDRSQMNYAVLIGRSVLVDLGAVDSSREDLWGKPKTLNKPRRSKNAKKPASSNK